MHLVIKIPAQLWALTQSFSTRCTSRCVKLEIRCFNFRFLDFSFSNYWMTAKFCFHGLLPVGNFASMSEILHVFFWFWFPPNLHWNFNWTPQSFHDSKSEMWWNSFALWLHNIFHENGIQIQIYTSSSSRGLQQVIKQMMHAYPSLFLHE